MHLQIILRGINTQVELWKILAQGQFFKWTRKDLETDKDFDVLFQMALRPSVIGTWELVFPKECLGTVLSMMGLTSPSHGIYGSISMKGTRMATLRLICGVKKIPKKAFDEAKDIGPSIVLENSHRGLHHLMVQGVAVHPIGILEDKMGEMYDPQTDKKYWQEML